MKDFYYILGTDINCTPDEIKAAYRKLSKKFHPDMNGEDDYFEGRFREINEAYETLIDPASRRVYDAALKRSQSVPPPGRPPEKPAEKPKYKYKAKGIDIAFSIMLVLITLVFGYYVYRSVSGTPKPAGVNKIVAIAPRTIRHHKKKHGLKRIRAINTSPTIAKIVNKPARLVADNEPPKTVKTVTKPVKIIADTTHIHIVKPAQVANNTVKRDNPIRMVSNTANNANSYAAYIRGNVTGVVYMRKFDNYAAAIVKIIPTNSQVVVLEKGSAYYKVSFDNEIGYVPKWTVTK